MPPDNIYHCPICGEPGYMWCEHMQAQGVKDWNEKQEAIRECYRTNRQAIIIYYALTSGLEENP